MKTHCTNDRGVRTKIAKAVGHVKMREKDIEMDRDRDRDERRETESER